MNHSKIFLFFASFVFSSIFFLFFARGAEAQLVINEFHPNSPEWVEFYNAGNDLINLSNFWFDDDNNFISDSGSSAKKTLSGLLGPGLTCYLDLSNFLNDSGDTPTIFDSSGAVIDSYNYSGSQVEKTYSRIPDGGEWVVGADATKSSVSCLSLPTPTPSPSPTPSPTPTPTQSSEKPKATLKINDARDQNDNVVSGATQIYIDGNYTGNYAPETYTFCDDCKCGSNNVPCGFGSHTIKVEKTGYKSWTKTIDISAGNSYEETPILTISTPTPSPTPKPSATPKTSPTPSLEAENTIQASESALTLNSSSEPRVLGLESAKIKEDKEASSSDSYFNLAAVFFIIAGLSFLSAASYAYFKSKKKKEEKQSEKQDSENQEDS